MHAHPIQLDVLRRHAWSRRRAPSRYLRFAARCICLIALLLLATVIAAYVYWTEPSRVRGLAEGFLTRVVDGDISIGQAKLSIFEGLQLDDVQIKLRDAEDRLPDSPRAVISAKRLLISYSTLDLLRGSLNSGRVVAIEPEVYLVEDVATGRWSVQSLFQRPTQPRPVATASSKPSRAPTLPEVLIRGARVHRAQINASGVYEPLQTVLLEGQLLPRQERGAYQFNLQSRTEQGTAGPAFQGDFSLAGGVAQSSLKNVELAFLEPMLPARVREFWRKLSPSGRVDVPVLSVSRSTLNADGSSTGQAGFRIELRLDDVNMIVRPTDWASSREQAVLNNAGVAARDVQQLPYGSLASIAASIQPKLRAGGEVPLQHVSGRFVFTERGVTLHPLTASIDNNPFEIDGALGGYSLDSPLAITLKSPAGRPIELHEQVPYINSLPAEFREIYYRFRPRGRSNLSFAINRRNVGGALVARGVLEFASANFEFDQFRYPIRNASGRLIVDADPRTGEPRLVIDDIRGNGPVGGPNEKGELRVGGVIAPLIGYASVEVDVSGNDIHSEPALLASLPPEAGQVIREFDNDGDGPNPVFEGDFVCRVRRAPGPISRWSYDTDVNVRHGHGALKEFPYPLEDFSAQIRVRKDHVEIADARSTHDGGTIELSGMSEWGTRVHPTTTVAGTQPATRPVGAPSVRTRLLVDAKNIPVDDALKNALPADVRDALNRQGIAGRVDIAGPVTVFDPKHPEFDLKLSARDGRFAPTDWATAIDGIVATMRLTPTSLAIEKAAGKRGESPIAVRGNVEWADEKHPTMQIEASGERVVLDQPLRDSLPTDARPVWDSIGPTGTTGGTVTLHGPIDAPTWSLELRPDGNANVLTDFLPLPATKLEGVIRANVKRVDIAELRGTIAGGAASISGVGELGERRAWNIAFKTAGTRVDADTCAALPAALGKTLLDNAVGGIADLDVRQLAWTRSPDGKSTDTIFDATVAMKDVTWTSGVTVDKANGSLTLRGHFIDDEPADLAGGATFPTLRIGGIDATEGSVTVAAEPEQKRIELRDVRAKLGEGDVAGRLVLDRRRDDVTRWQADFLLRNANVGQLVAAADNVPKVNGRMNASLSIEGAYGGADAQGAARAAAAFPRRGRGDISVTGENMLHVPMVLGMTQVVSLALPFTGGFNEATASYSLDGDRVRFGEISLQSNEMRIKGAGWLDFGDRQLNLDFYTDTTGRKLPVVGGLLDAARRELLQIKIRGSLSEPTVKAGSLRTITTTIDEILGADEASKK